MINIQYICKEVKHNAVAGKDYCRKCKKLCGRPLQTLIAFKDKFAINGEVNRGADYSCGDICKGQVNKVNSLCAYG